MKNNIGSKFGVKIVTSRVIDNILVILATLATRPQANTNRSNNMHRNYMYPLIVLLCTFTHVQLCMHMNYIILGTNQTYKWEREYVDVKEVCWRSRSKHLHHLAL